MKKLPIEWTEEVEEETGLTLENFLKGHLENHLENALKEKHPNVTEKDVFAAMLEKEEEKFGIK